mgnify:FL=1
MDAVAEGERRSPTDPRDPAFEIPDEIVCDLRKPFKKVAAGEERVARIVFRPPTVGEMKQVGAKSEKEGEARAAIFMMALLNNDKLTEPDIERMNFVDFQLCVEKLQPFLELAKPSPPKG